MSKMKSEIVRKLIHFLGLFYIPAYDLLGKEFMILAIGLLTAIAVLLEALRRRFKIFPDFLLRNYEQKGLGAYLYSGISALLITVFLPKDACFAGIVAGSLGDGVAGILKHGGKMAKGYASVGMFLSSMLALTLLGLDFVPSLIAVIAGVIAERIEKIGRFYINDNLSVPIASATTFYIVETILKCSIVNMLP
jgi:dolichol kinase